MRLRFPGRKPSGPKPESSYQPTAERALGRRSALKPESSYQPTAERASEHEIDGEDTDSSA
jgi:hypothetical protein